MKTRIITILFLSALLICSCYYDRESELYGNGNCDTTNTTYSSTIAGMISRYGCLNCHSGVSASGGFSLEGYTNVKAKVIDGKLQGAVNHTPGFSAMPQGAPKMNECDLAKMNKW